MLDAAEQEELFERLFEFKSLESTFNEHYLGSTTRGYDGLTAEQTIKSSEMLLESLCEKVLNQKFRFTPFKEKLILKNRNSEPRMVSIPTVRDRLVLKQLNAFLTTLYPEIASLGQPKKVVMQVIDYLQSKPVKDLWVYSGDFVRFFDSIPQEPLLEALANRISCKPALSLVKRACLTPTLPLGTPKKEYSEFKPDRGVPQGISIANTLASIYLKEIDEAMTGKSYFYARYVDDVLIVGTKDEVLAAKDELSKLAVASGLSMHTQSKEHFQPATEQFQFLGYLFNLPEGISVRDSSVEKLKQKIISICSEHKDYQLDGAVFELNKSITGYVNMPKAKHHAWIGYYNQITDLKLLYELDAFVMKQLLRSHQCQKRPRKLKSFVRAYHESRHSLLSGYIPQGIAADKKKKSRKKSSVATKLIKFELDVM